MYLQAMLLIAKKIVRAQGSISSVFYVIRKNWRQTLSQIVCYVQVYPRRKSQEASTVPHAVWFWSTHLYWDEVGSVGG